MYSEFFEECIAEEQFEAKKLDIMKDALRARPGYEQKAKVINNTDVPEAAMDHSELSPSPEPVVAPDQPVVAPDQPVVAPDQPVVAPDQPVVAPDQPVVAPDQPKEVPA